MAVLGNCPRCGVRGHTTNCVKMTAAGWPPVARTPRWRQPLTFTACVAVGCWIVAILAWVLVR